MLNKTKIIATIGPSSNHPHIIKNMIKSGMNVARLNMSHKSSDKDILQTIKTIREEASRLDTHVGILMDIAGPKIRVDLSNINDAEIEVIKNHVYSLGYSKMNDIPINMDIDFKKMNESNSFVKVDDGKISFKIISIANNILKVKALNNGLIISNKGINFPGVDLKIPSLTEMDKKNILLGLKLEIDWFALSFVRSHRDYNAFRKVYANQDISIPIIAKIEKPEAMDDLDAIIESFDGILIARGDLGVEMSLSKLPIIQKKIIKKCRTKSKPVIIATQILESMIHSSLPTRAEVNDVANAVYEQVDAVMLSGETAVGEYPIETIDMMNNIILNVEMEFDDYKIVNESGNVKDTRYAIGEAVKTISRNLDIDSIVVMTESGSTTEVVSYFRPKANIYSLSPFLNICNKMTLYWGVISIKSEHYLSTDEMLISAETILLEKKYMKKNQTFVMTAGIPVGISGSTNMLKIQKIS